MSKKRYSTARWKRYLKSRQDSEMRNARRRRRRRQNFVKRRRTASERRRFQVVVAPSVFSMVKNPEGVTAFLRNLEYYAQRYNLSLDLSGISEMETNAIAPLVATLKKLPGQMRGNLPTMLSAQKILVESGFFDHVDSKQPLPRSSQGEIAREKSKKVQPDLAKYLIHFGTNAIYGNARRSHPAYRTLIESMANTHDHASKDVLGQETWWATVYADTARGRVCFTFVDTGVGIFRSARVGFLRSAYRLLGVKDDKDILQDMLLGKVQSRTKYAYRGKGLPAIFKLSQDGRIKSLVIVANDVYANVSAGEYKMLDVEFIGTLLYWEI